MKICPTCQQNFPNGFQYCPNDTELLLTPEEYQRQTKPIAQKPEVSAAPVMPVMTEVLSVAEAMEGPAVEVVPLTAPMPQEAPTSGVASLSGKLASLPEPAAPTEPIKSVTQSQPRSVEPNGHAQSVKATQVAAPFAAVPTKSDDLNFALPEAGSLISRLVAGLKNVGDVFQRVSGVQAAGSGFQLILPEESLSTRIAAEVGAAWAEFRRDPKRFVVEFARGEGSNRLRRNMLLAGSEMAVVGFFSAYFVLEAFITAGKVSQWYVKALFVAFVMYLIGCYLVRGFLLYKVINRATNKLVLPKVALEIANWAPLAVILLLSVLLSNYSFYCKIFPGKCVVTEDPLENLTLLTPLTDVPTDIDIKLQKSAAAKEKQIGGSLNKPKAASGGGGGGRNQPTPPSKGVPPPMALTPQIVMPNPEPPKIKDPSLAVVPTIYGDPRALPPMKGPLGDPTGVPGPPSSGPGSGAGIGRGSGTGVGGGEGGGLGPGRGGNTGGGDMGLGGGRSVEPMTASLSPTILYKEKAKYTEEARQNKVQGTVVLNVVFTADGRITNIKVVRGLPDGLTEKAIEAAQKIRFQPAVKAGQPVSVRGNLEFTFNLY